MQTCIPRPTWDGLGVREKLETLATAIECLHGQDSAAWSSRSDFAGKGSLRIKMNAPELVGNMLKRYDVPHRSFDMYSSSRQPFNRGFASPDHDMNNTHRWGLCRLL